MTRIKESLHQLEEIKITRKQEIKDSIKYLPLYNTLDSLLEGNLTLQMIESMNQKEGIEIPNQDPNFTSFKIEIAKYIESFLNKHINNTDFISLTELLEEICKKHISHFIENGMDLEQLEQMDYIARINFLKEECMTSLSQIEKIFITVAEQNFTIFAEDPDYNIDLRKANLSEALEALIPPKKSTNNKFESFDIDNGERCVLHDSNGNCYVYDKDPLGAGANGEVVIAINIDTGEKVVIKIVPHNPEVEFHNSQKYIVNGKPFAENYGKGPGSSYILVLQYIEGKTFGDNVHAGKVEEKDTYSALQECLAAAQELQKLHTKSKLYHGDITPENAFIRKDESGSTEAIFIDFGAAKKTTTEEGLVGYSPIYTSPEIMKKIVYNCLEIEIQPLIKDIPEYKKIVTGKIQQAQESSKEYREELRLIKEDEENGLTDSDKAKRKKELLEIISFSEKTINLLNFLMQRLDFIVKNEGHPQIILEKELKRHIDSTIEALHNIPYDFLNFEPVEFKYTEQQEIYSLGKVFERKGISNQTFKDLVAKMTSENGKRPNIEDVIAGLQEALQEKDRHSYKHS